MSSLDDLVFVNFPRHLSLDDYQAAESDFIAKYAAHPDTLSIYRFGAISQPGISDLDFVVVMRPVLSRPLTRDYGFDFFDETTSYILSHNPILMPPVVFEGFARIFPVTGLGHVYGEELALIDPEPSAKWVCDLLTLVYISGHQYPTLFLQMLSMPTLDVRLSIQLLNALNHAATLCTGLSGQRPDNWAAFSSAVNRLKAEWFDQDSRQRLVTLVELADQAGPLSVQLLKATANLVQERLWCLRDSARPVGGFQEVGRYLWDTRLFGIMADDFDPIPITKNAFDVTYRWWRLLPAVYLLPLLEHSRLDGPYSEQLKRGLFGAIEDFRYLDPLARDALRSSGALYNALYRFHASNALSTLVSMFPGDAPLSGPKAEPSNLLRKSLSWAGKLRRELEFRHVMQTGDVYTKVRV